MCLLFFPLFQPDMGDVQRMSFPYFNEQEYFNAWTAFLEVIPTERVAMCSLVKSIIDGFDPKNLNMLSIGAGTGSFEDLLITEYGLSLEYYYAIEPNDDHVKQLESTVSKWNIKYTIDKTCFTPDTKLKEKFDLVLMSHCLYYIPNPTEAIVSAKSFLKPDGKLLILHNTEQGGACQLIRKFQSLASLDTALVCNHGLSLEEVSKNLTQKGIQNYIKREPVDLDVGNFITKRDSGIISFILQTWYENFPSSIQKEIYQFVREKCINPEPEKYLLPCPVGMLVTQ